MVNLEGFDRTKGTPGILGCSPARPMRVAVLVSGRGSNLAALLEARARGELPLVEFVLVASDVDEPPAFEHARRHGVPTRSFPPREFRGRDAREAAMVEAMRAAGADLVVLAGYMRIVGPTLLAAWPGRIVNIHPSLLPAFPGLHAQRQALEHGAKVSGCTVHFVDEGMDTGPIISQEAVEVRDDDDEASLSARILEREHRALPAAIDAISRGLVHVEGRRVRWTKSESGG